MNKEMKNEWTQLKKIKGQIDTIGKKYRDGIEEELEEIEEVWEIIHKMSMDEINDVIHSYPIENKDKMYPLMTALCLLEMGNGDIKQAESLWEDYRYVTKTFYLYRMDIYDLYSQQLKMDKGMID